MKTPTLNPSNVAASICRDELYFFVQQFWDVMISEPPVWNWHIKYLCDELQEMLERVVRREKKLYDLIINVPPGTTKSTIASVALPAWVWSLDPSIRSIHGSHTEPLALELSGKSRRLIRSDKYKEYFPNVQIQSDRDALGFFESTAGGMRKSLGSGGSVIGRHAHYLDVDDPIDPEAARSDQDTGKINRWLTETLMQRVVNRATAPLILIMQRLAQDDPTGYMLDMFKDRNRIRHICLPAELSDDVRPVELRLRYVDGLLDPIRLNRDALADAREIMLDYGYAGQMMQTPIPEGGAMFNVKAIRFGRPPPITQFKELVRSWDKAGTHKGGAFTVGVLMGRDADNVFWLLDVKRGQWATNERERIIVQTAREDGKHILIVMEQEPGSGGKESAEGTIGRLAGYRVRADTVKGDKVLRADEFSYQVNAGNFWLPDTPNLHWVNAYLQEMQYFPYSKYKDQIDASSLCYAMLARSRRRVGAFR